MEFELVLSLPREAETAHVTREVLDASLRVLGATDEVRGDIALALGEATANVIQHAEPSDEYQVRIHLVDERCVIEVVDAGRGFDMAVLDSARPDMASTAERGRGLKIIEALAESFSIANRRRQGAMVRFEIPLEWPRDSHARTLTESTADTAGAERTGDPESGGDTGHGHRPAHQADDAVTGIP